MSSPHDLRGVRELLGYRADSVARMAGISPERLAELEDGDALTVLEADRLERLYGIPADELAEQPIKLATGDAVEVLASKDEFKELSDATRSRVVAAANAARELVQLETLLHEREGRLADARKRLPKLTLKRGSAAHHQGADLARQLRRKLDLSTRPIPSLRDLVRAEFSFIAVLHARLGVDGPAAVCFVDHFRGPAIVLNLEGKNTNATVRRFSLAHELGHLLVDWTRVQPLAIVSGYLTETHLDMERRANAFAVRFLCPPSVLQRLRPDESPAQAARTLSAYGLPYAAVRLYLRNEGARELPQMPPPELVAAGLQDRWIDAEDPIGIHGFPIDAVPPERRTEVAWMAARAYSKGLLQRDAFAKALGVPPTADLEAVLDYFVLSPPAESAA